MRQVRERLATLIPPILVGSVVLLLWQVAIMWSGTRILPAPLGVLRGFRELIERGVLTSYAADSLVRVAIGFGLAVLVGTPVGMLMGMRRDLAIALNPIVQLLRPISPLAWTPIAVVLLGVGDAPAVFLIFLAALFPIIVSAMTAVSSVREVHVRAGRNFGLSGRQILTRILLPAALPQLLIGYRLTLGIAWLVVVAAEMIAVDSGLGYLVIDSRNAGNRYDLVVAAMVAIGVIGLTLDFLIRRLERIRQVRWSKFA